MQTTRARLGDNASLPRKTSTLPPRAVLRLHSVMHFAELIPGRVIHLGPASLTEQQIVEYARVYDPQWFHTDPRRAAASQWQGLIASGWQTCGVGVGLACGGNLQRAESICPRAAP